MKAVICTRYGPPEVLRLVEVARPVPHRDEVLVQVHATTVTAGDTRIRGFNLPAAVRPLARVILGFRAPRKRILGMELAGEVVAAGSAVTRFNVGDRVFGCPSLLSVGTYAEYACLRDSPGRPRRVGVVSHIPPGMSWEGAAALPVGGLTALGLLRKAHVSAGRRVLVYGASGSVGTFAVQIARHQGAEVTGVCGGGNLELVRSLGAGRVMDYTKEDFAGGSERFDVVLDAVGKLPRARARAALAPGGVCVSVMGSFALEPGDLGTLGDLAAGGAVRPVVDRRYTLSEIVEAHRYVDTGRKRGNVVIVVRP